MIRNFGWLVISGLLLFTAPAAAELTGAYKITAGTNPDNMGSYTGRVDFEYVRGDVHRVLWMLESSPPARGLGFLVESNMFCAAFNPAGDVGLAVYSIEGGTLTGQWVDHTTDGYTGKEVLKGSPSLEGTYTIVSSSSPDPGEPSYAGSVEIHKNGENYQIRRIIGEKTYEGVALLKGRKLIVGWGPGAGVIYYNIKDNNLGGWWAIRGTPSMGTETLMREE